MKFLGKHRFTQGQDVLQVNASGDLVFGPPPSDGSDRFNSYARDSGFVLQAAANGQFVVSSGNGYQASQDAGDKGNTFVREGPSAAPSRIKDIGPGDRSTPLYWDHSGSSLAPTSTGTEFALGEITPGIDDILVNGLGSSPPDLGPDLTWVDLSGTDFTTAQSLLDFTSASLSHANFAKAKFAENTGFNGATAEYADFSHATLASCILGNINFSYASFDHANMQGVQAEHSSFDYASLKYVDWSNGSGFGSTNTDCASFKYADLRGTSFKDAFNVGNNDFSNANCSGVVFTGASITNQVIFNDANLTDAALNNLGPGPQTTIYPGYIKLNAKTNFTGATLTYLDLSEYDLNGVIFTHADLSNTKLHAAKLQNAELGYAVLDGCDLTGTVPLHGANLSNASLKGVDLTGAQLGALAVDFQVPSSSTPTYADFLKALEDNDTVGVARVFKQYDYPLSGTVTITQSRFNRNTWTVSDTTSATEYDVEVQKIGGGDTLMVSSPTTPAVLTNALLVNAKLNNANLIGVNASGAAIYAISKGQNGMNLALMREMQLNNANLSNQNFSNAAIAGVSFDYAILTNSNFSLCRLTTAPSGARTSFNGANLTGANFDGASLDNIVFTNAAFGIPNELDSNPKAVSAGAWLFAMAQAQADTVTAELNAAMLKPGASPPGQFDLPVGALNGLKTAGPVPQRITEVFNQNHIALTGNAVLTIMDLTAYWQLTDRSTHYVIFQTYEPGSGPLDAASPALGVASGSDYSTQASFYLPLSLQADLNNGRVELAVVNAFKQAGHSISNEATIATAQQPSEWQIINAAPDYQLYSLWLNITYQGTAITIRPAISSVISAFGNASIAISRRATVAPLNDSADSNKCLGWVLDNDSANPFNPVKNYIRFNLLPTPAGGIDVYGSFIRIERETGPDQLQYYNIPAALTALTQTQMKSPGDVAPNGEFATTNSTNQLPFSEWLRPRIPPRPPFCVPDPAGMSVCPD